jgi:peroxiredoxin
MATHSATASVGTAAPRFVLPDHDGHSVVFDDLLRDGPVVLVFVRGFA